MSVLAALDDRVGTMRLRSAADDPAFGAACRSAVRSATLPRRGRQILVVRSLVVGASADDAIGLQRDVSNEVDAAWRRARRPSEAGGADAVVFRDRVELLALLLSDIAGDQLAHRWWWAVVGGQIAPRGTTVADVLVEHPREVPAIVAELDRSARLDAVIARLDDSCAYRVIAAVAAAFSLAPTFRSVAVASTASDPVPGTRRPAVLASTRPTTAQRALVHLARQLVADPSAARSVSASASEADGIAAAADAGSAHDAVEDPQAQRSMPPSGRDRRARPSGGDAQPVPRPGGRGLDRPRTAAAVTPTTPGGDDVTAALPSIADAPDWMAARMAAATDDGAPPALGRRYPEAVEPTDAVGAGGLARQIGADEPASTLAAGTEAATGLGGVFFLIAPLLELRAGEAFGERFASAVGWWGSLELLARSLVPVAPDVDREPVWDVLASLNGGRSALDRVRTLRYGDLRTPTGWPPADPDGAGPVALGTTVASELTGPSFDWLEHVRGAFVAHVCARLDVDADSLVDVVLRRRATIVVDRMHVDVVFPLDAAQLAVRRAGFDRDPGWVPELGRVVLFNFGGHHADREWSS